MASVVSINLSQKKGVIKDPVKEATLLDDFGFEHDAHAGNWHRQVSLLGLESFKKLTELSDDLNLKPGIFAENITTDGIVLYDLKVGTQLKIGDTLHEVTQIGKECHHGCEIFYKVGDCVMPREGIFTRVLKGGTLKVGDSIEVIEA